jgi:hypothetical protein
MGDDDGSLTAVEARLALNRRGQAAVEEVGRATSALCGAWCGMEGEMERADESSVTRVVSRDGTEIGYWTSGAGQPLVLVHGTTADHTRRRPLPPYYCGLGCSSPE